MKADYFVCDVCGAAIDRHGKRFTLTLSRVPAVRATDGARWDLCPECAARLKIIMERDRDIYGKPW